VLCILLLTCVLFVPQVRKLNYAALRGYRPAKPPVYEIGFILLFIFLMLPSIWNCYLLPPNARDMLIGPEPLAEFTVREHTMINSIFTVDLTYTNNHLKPPFVAGLQIVYKLLVQPFGQVWLSVLVVNFLVWLYLLMRRHMHGLPAGILMLFFIAMPDPYGYTYMMLFDYANMVLFFAGFYFLLKYTDAGQYNVLLFAAFLFGLATIIRSETVVLIAMLLPVLLYAFYREQLRPLKTIIRVVLFLTFPFFFYYLWMGIFVKYYFPVSFDVSEQLRLSPASIMVFFTRIKEIAVILLFSETATRLYGLMNYLFALVLIADCIFIRKFSRRALLILYGIAVVYVGMAILGAIIPWFDVMNTSKRGIYKMFPLMMLYYCNSGVVARLSAAIRRFEFPQMSMQAKPVRAASDNRQTKRKK
jgi:hypothetical protein